MDHFFKVTHLPDVLAYRSEFCPVGVESVSLHGAWDRILASDLVADLDLPRFFQGNHGRLCCGGRIHLRCQ